MERETKRQRISYSSYVASEPETNIEELPYEILVLILSFLDGASLISCSGVCVSWNNLISTQDNLFKYHCQQKLGKGNISRLAPSSWKSYFLSLRNDTFLNLILEAMHSLAPETTTEISTTPFETYFPEPNQRQRNTMNFITLGLKLAESNKDFQLQVLESARKLYLDSAEVHNSFSTELDDESDDDLDDDEELTPLGLLSKGRKFNRKHNYYVYALYARKAAEMGLSSAQNAIGMCLIEGTGVENNPKEAVQWFRAAAAQEYNSAQYNLAVCYMDGVGVQQDLKEGIKLMTQLAEKGHASAQSYMASSYLDADGVAQNYNEAFRLATLAANAGHAHSQYTLGRCYMEGLGVEKDEKEGIRWFTASAEHENQYGQYELGSCYLFGTGVEKNQKEAIRLLTLSAKQGYMNAQMLLGMCYMRGEGVEKDLKEGVKWVKLAAEAGILDAQGVLGDAYLFGYGVEKDEKEAVKWLSMAAEKGHHSSQYSLSYCYIRGVGVEKNIREALKWLVMSTEKGTYAKMWESSGIDRSRMIKLLLHDEVALQEFLDKYIKEHESSQAKDKQEMNCNS